MALAQGPTNITLRGRRLPQPYFSCSFPGRVQNLRQELLRQGDTISPLRPSIFSVGKDLHEMLPYLTFLERSKLAAFSDFPEGGKKIKQSSQGLKQTNKQLSTLESHVLCQRKRMENPSSKLIKGH